MTTPTILDDYIADDQLATELNVHPRTLARYRGQPDGLPFVLIGGRIHYRRESVSQWLARRERQPNPTRKHAAAGAVA